MNKATEEAWKLAYKAYPGPIGIGLLTMSSREMALRAAYANYPGPLGARFCWK